MGLISIDRFKSILANFETIEPLVVFGDIGLDKYTHGEVNRISPEAPVPVLEVTKEWYKLGLAANVSDNLKSLGVKSTICSAIGDDVTGSKLESILEEKEFSTWGLVRCKNRKTTIKERVTTFTQQICRVDYESKQSIESELESKLEARFDDFVKDHSAIIIEDYAKGLVSERLVQYLVKSFGEKGKLIAVDPGRDRNPSLYKGATLLKPNRVEAEIMANHLGYPGTKDLNEISSILIDKLELKKLIITLGKDGMALVDTENGDGKLHIIPTAANEVFDVSGAGDTAVSAIVSSLVAGASLEEAAWIGNCASGVVVAKHGTATVNAQELLDFYSNLKSKLKQ